MDTLSNWIPNVIAFADEFPCAIVDTLIMLVITGIVSFIIALPLAVLVVITKPDGIAPNKAVFWIWIKSSTCFAPSRLSS